MLRKLQYAAAIGGLAFGVSACSEHLDIPDYNRATTTGVGKDPQGIQVLATGIIERERSLAPGSATEFGFIGRESYVYFATDGRNITGFLVGVPGPGGIKTIDPGGFAATNTNWNNRYNNMRNAVNLIAAVNGSSVPDAQKKATSGFAKTFRALDLMYVLYARDTLGAPVDVNDNPSPPPPFVSKDSAYKFVTGMLDDAKADLVAAGSADFPFVLSRGYDLFNTPAKMIKLNRAIMARALVNRGSQGCGNACYTQALTALGESFVTATASSLTDLNIGAYHNYSTATGDVANSNSYANNKSLFAHASAITDAKKQADGTTLDDRAVRKLTKLDTPVSPPQGLGIPATYTFNIYPLQNTDIPLIRNEELILLRAEANIQLNNLAAALTDINTIRTVSGKLPALGSLGTQAQALDELLYNRRYSLLLEGQRWNDMRRFNRLNQLPLDITSGANAHAIFKVQPVPLAECDARPDNKPQGCP
jgi:hypothetical protein